MSPEMTVSTPGTVGEDGFVPLTVEEARALMTEALAGVDRDSLLAERAEAEAQLRAAEATLGIAPATGNGRSEDEQEREEPAQKPQDVDIDEDGDGRLDVEALRRAATVARAADNELARAASEAAERPPTTVAVTAGSGSELLGVAESALGRALEVQEELPAAWRRLVGALISATGMAIVIGALGWNVYWLLVPIALIAIMTVDLRLAGKSARQVSAEAAQELASVGVAGADGLELIRLHRAKMEEAEARLATARAEHDAAYARFEELAPGRRPSEVEEIVAEYEAELAARREARAAQAEAEAAQAEAEAARAETATTGVDDEGAPDEAEAMPPETAAAEPAATTPEPAAEKPVAAEWWFGSKEPPPPPAEASAPVRALAERLSAEGREALARIEAQLAALDRVELAKRSLEWHEANGSAEVAADGPPEKP